ncbi:hypothetical protein [Marinobacter sp.]|uniref:hypothetical protein n=1 Tax=Marinobacter sp. TaxID=50741 RepID=UPI0034A2D846
MDAGKIRKVIGGFALAASLLPLAVAAEPVAVDGEGSEAFDYRERSTVKTIPLRSMEEDTLANTVIEGGLEAPAAGVPVQPRNNEDFYLDPLALQPRDSRTDLGRNEIPVEFRFSNPKVIPGQTHSNNYLIRPPQNRTYQTQNINTTGR